MLIFVKHNTIGIKRWLKDGFGRECESLGFQMDCGEKFVLECKKRGCKIPYGEGFKEAVADIDDIEVIEVIGST